MTTWPKIRMCLGLFAVLLAGIATSGCGYTQGGLYPSDINTVAVPIFQNKTFEQGLEFEVTEAIIKEIELRTPYKVVSSTSADTIIEGNIIAVRRNRLSQDSDFGLIQEYEYVIHVNVEWKNVRTGKTLRRRDNLQSVGRAVPGGFANEPVEVGQHEATQRLAHNVVAIMRADW